jgi:lysozyme
LPITIGWGSTRNFDGKPFKITDKINSQQANLLIEHQIKTEFLPALEKIPYWGEMNDNQRGTLLCFAYNLGADFYNSGDGFYTISLELSNKNWKAIPKTLEMYRNPGTNVEAGLLRRRRAEGKLWST